MLPITGLRVLSCLCRLDETEPGHFETFDSLLGMVDNRHAGPDRPPHRSTIDAMRYACPKECSTRLD